MPQLLEKLIQLAEADKSVEVAWLYGSRATGSANNSSDYDIAVAFQEFLTDRYQAMLRPQELSRDWGEKLMAPISIVDINQIPIPLAYNAVAANYVLTFKNSMRLIKEEQRISSMWEEYKYEHEKHRH